MYKDVIWGAQETQSVIYRAIRTAGARGTTRKALQAACGKSGSAVDWHLLNMKRDEFIRQPTHSDGSTRWGRWVVGTQRPKIDGMLIELVMEMVADCPAGVSAAVLCEEIGCTWHEIYQALQAGRRDSRLRAMYMPAEHGGGLGLRLAVEDDPALMGLAVAPQDDAALRDLPVVEVDINRIHHVHAARALLPFVCELQDGRLKLSAEGQSLALSAPQTEHLLRYLAPHVPTQVGL